MSKSVASKQMQAGRKCPSKLVALGHTRSTRTHAFANREQCCWPRFESIGARSNVASRIMPPHRAWLFKNMLRKRPWQIQTLTRRLSIKLLVPVLGDRGLLAHGAHVAPARGGIHICLAPSRAEVCWSRRPSQGTQGRCRHVLNKESLSPVGNSKCG